MPWLKLNSHKNIAIRSENGYVFFSLGIETICARSENNFQLYWMDVLKMFIILFQFSKRAGEWKLKTLTILQKYTHTKRTLYIFANAQWEMERAMCVCVWVCMSRRVRKGYERQQIFKRNIWLYHDVNANNFWSPNAEATLMVMSTVI